jgi:hypothetical protein
VQRQLLVESKVFRRELLELVGDVQQFGIVLWLGGRSFPEQHVLDRLRQCLEQLAVVHHACQLPVAQQGLAVRLWRAWLVAGLVAQTAVGFLREGRLLRAASLVVVVQTLLLRLRLGRIGPLFHQAGVDGELHLLAAISLDAAVVGAIPRVIHFPAEGDALEQAEHLVQRGTIVRNKDFELEDLRLLGRGLERRGLRPRGLGQEARVSRSEQDARGT